MIKRLIPKTSWIISEDNPLLRMKCEDIAIPIGKKDANYINKMVSYIDSSYYGHHDEDGIRPGMAIAAPQVGLSKKVLYMFFDYDDVTYKLLLANPKVITKSEEIICLQDGEGCLSDTEHHEGIVLRHKKIILEAVDMLDKNNVKTFEFEGVPAICVQHELDHLDGVLYFDKIEKNEINITNNKNIIKI